MRRSQHLNRNPRLIAGFTLVELMVSSALLGLIMFVLLAATGTSLALWRSSERAISVDREGRNAMALMSEDLAIMLPVAEDAPPYLQPCFAVWNDYVFMEFLVLRPRDYQEPDAGGEGDVCYVRYRYNDNRIERAALDSADTFAALISGKRPNPTKFEVLADNLPSFFIGAYDDEGKKLNPEGSASDIPKIHAVDISLASVDMDEMQNRRADISARDRGTTMEMLSSMQYFSTFVHIPRP